MARRFFGIAALMLLSFYLWVPDLSRGFGHPLAQLGLSVNANAVVVKVDPRQASSGVRVGDRFDLARANWDQHWTYVTMRHINLPPLSLGGQYTAPMLRNGTPYLATIQAFPEDPNNVPAVFLRAAVQLFAMALGTLVLLRRPSPASWALFVLLFVGCAGLNVSAYYGPFWWRDCMAFLYYLFGWNVPGAWAAIVFALYLLHDGPLPRWRRFALSAALALGAVSCAIAFFEAYTALFAPRPYPGTALAYSALIVFPLLIAPAVLVATYFESSAAVRERLRWIIGGFTLAALCTAADQASSGGNLGLFQESYLTHSLLNSATYLFISLPVAYAILKHHIIDVNVALSRATVYTALSVFIVGMFALVDLFFTRALDQKSAGLIADIGLALILGFSFNAMHRHVDAFVDRFIFRSRHAAEQYVRGLAAAMLHARTETQARTMLTNEAQRAFDLSSARLVSAFASGDERIDLLGAYVETHGAVRLTDGQWNVDAGLAVPVFSHGALSEIALYGVHANGTDLDAEEAALLGTLASSAGAALDRLEADQLRAAARDLRIQNTTLQDALERLSGAATNG
ncbi:MAG TPA: hypothetical protein VJP85_11185 [Candidatus Baltobacteraceae bacterium]|nr:hypothetical protein [Candidatus Baltobacteraceae bacterium]